MSTPFRQSLLLFIRFFLCYSFVTVGISIVAQPSNSSYKYSLQSHDLSLEDGLSSMHIDMVFRDSKGFLWLGTNNGLNRYDGYNYKVYTKEKNGLFRNTVKNIGEDTDGNIWLGYYSYSAQEKLLAAEVLNPISGIITPAKTYLAQKGLQVEGTISYFKSTQDREIIFKTKDHKYYNYTGKTLDFLFHFPTSNCDFIYKTSQGNFWAGSRSAIGFYNSSNKELRTEAWNITRLPRFTALGIDHEENLYVHYPNTTDQVDSCKFILKKTPTGLEYPINLQVKDSRWSQMLPKAQKIITWEFDLDQKSRFIVSDYEGNCLDRIELELPIKSPDVQKNPEKGQVDGYWITQPSYNTVKVLFLGQLFFNKHLVDRAPPFVGRKIIADDNNNIYFSSVHEVVQYNQQEKTYQSLAQKLDANYTLLYDSLSKKLFIPDTRKLTQYHSKSQTLDTFTKDLRTICISILQDKNKKIWFGNKRGLSYWEENKPIVFEQYNQFDILKNHSIYDFHENKEGIWMASDLGLFLMDWDKGIIDHIDPKSPHRALPHSIILDIYEDSAGYFWLGSRGGGLIKWHPKQGTVAQYTTDNGLSNNTVYSIYEDADQHLWLSTDYGINRFNQHQASSRVYHKTDGLPHEEFNLKSHFQANDGTIYFGGMNGFVSFHPKDFQNPDSFSTYPLRLTAFLKRNPDSGEYEDYTSSLLNDKKITLQANEKSFLLRFALLNFRSPDKHKYAYRIDGIDKEEQWNYLQIPEITFNGLDYGEYTIYIKAQGVGGLWSKDVLEFPIIVLRPFYLQTWFILLSACCIILVLGLSVRWRIRNLQKRQTELEEEVAKRTQQIQQDKLVIEEQAEDLKALDEVKSRFFANISHELRTPLTLILGPLSYILTLDNFDEADVRKKLETMSRNGKSLLLLIEEILDLSKLDADKLEVTEEEVQVQHYLRRIFTAFDAQAEYLGITTQLDYQLATDLYLLLDLKKVEKILNNLLSNALKFTPKGRSITMKVREDKHQLCIQIIDQGRGIHHKDLPHVFERFYQSKQRDQKAQGGTGIGLALSSELAQLMQGNLSVQSELDQGAVFTLYLPLKIISKATFDSSSEIIETEELPFDDLIILPDNLRVLVVEDNDDMRSFLVDILSPKYNPVSVGNGLKAIEYLQANPNDIDLIVSDLMMPEMDGFELLERVKQDNDWRKIPLIMLTARAGQKDKLKALTIGVDSYLTKPFVIEELLAQVGNTLFNYHQRRLWQTDELSDEMLPQIAEETTDSSPNLSLEDQNWIQSVEEQALKNISNNQYNVTQLYLDMHMTEQTFRRNLKRITGLSPVKYLRELRLDAARHLLEIKKYNTIAQVCAATGFSTPNYFAKLFKNRYGKSPGDYL